MVRLLGRLELAQPHDVGGNGCHDALVFVRVLVAVIDAGCAALPVVRYAVHGITPEPQAGHTTAEGTSEIMGRRTWCAQRGADLTHRAGKQGPVYAAQHVAARGLLKV